MLMLLILVVFKFVNTIFSLEIEFGPAKPGETDKNSQSTL